MHRATFYDLHFHQYADPIGLQKYLTMFSSHVTLKCGNKLPHARATFYDLHFHQYARPMGLKKYPKMFYGHVTIKWAINRPARVGRNFGNRKKISAQNPVGVTF